MNVLRGKKTGMSSKQSKTWSKDSLFKFNAIQKYKNNKMHVFIVCEDEQSKQQPTVLSFSASGFSAVLFVPVLSKQLDEWHQPCSQPGEVGLTSLCTSVLYYSLLPICQWFSDYVDSSTCFSRHSCPGASLLKYHCNWLALQKGKMLK